MTGDVAAETAQEHPGLRMSAVRVFVRDIEAARAFYGGPLELACLAEGDGWAVYDLETAQLVVETLEPGDDDGEALIGRFAGVSLTSDDILGAFDLLSERNVQFLAPPAKQEWGGYLAHFFDPDGNVISLVSTL
jgi:extradiol dioxygenase family protein